MNNTVVITPTIGRDTLYDSLMSVQGQTVSVDHLVVVDGPEFDHAVTRILDTIGNPSNITKLVLPENTGQGKFYGHRVIAAMSHIVNKEYVFLLDDDNWYEHNHVETLRGFIEHNSFDWAYSLRSISNSDRSISIYDNSISLGDLCEIVPLDQVVVDTSTYAFTGSFFSKYGNNWHGGWGADRFFFSNVASKHKYGCSMMYTSNYRLGHYEEEESIPTLIETNMYHDQCGHSKRP